MIWKVVVVTGRHNATELETALNTHWTIHQTDAYHGGVVYILKRTNDL